MYLRRQMHNGKIQKNNMTNLKKQIVNTKIQQYNK